ncbi:hypothetical protein QCD79_34655, partial [Pseudomonas quasicaspiana]|nr:hypothetical protein [Pseudomonas quasicaspiana]
MLLEPVADDCLGGGVGFCFWRYRVHLGGIKEIDTAEMYPVPPKAETYTATETIIGNWFKQQGDRADWI